MVLFIEVIVIVHIIVVITVEAIIEVIAIAILVIVHTITDQNHQCKLIPSIEVILYHITVTMDQFIIIIIIQVDSRVICPVLIIEVEILTIISLVGQVM
jgi:hypothetical protein